MKLAKNTQLAIRLERILATGMVPEQLAVEIGVSLSTLNRWRAGKTTRPHRATLRALEEIEQKQKEKG